MWCNRWVIWHILQLGVGSWRISWYNRRRDLVETEKFRQCQFGETYIHDALSSNEIQTRIKARPPLESSHSHDVLWKIITWVSRSLGMKPCNFLCRWYSLHQQKQRRPLTAGDAKKDVKAPYQVQAYIDCQARISMSCVFVPRNADLLRGQERQLVVVRSNCKRTGSGLNQYA